MFYFKISPPFSIMYEDKAQEDENEEVFSVLPCSVLLRLDVTRSFVCCPPIIIIIIIIHHHRHRHHHYCRSSHAVKQTIQSHIFLSISNIRSFTTRITKSPSFNLKFFLSLSQYVFILLFSFIHSNEHSTPVADACSGVENNRSNI